MKRMGNLYWKVAEMENLRLAFWKAQRGKKGKLEVRKFRENLDDELQNLHEQLLLEDVPVGNYHYFTIHDPKERVICAADFPERVLHHAIMNVCEPFFERYQIYDSYACRKGKGVDACLARLQEMCRRHRWYLKLDVCKYFDSIPHDVLKDILKRHFKDNELLELFGKIINSYEVSSERGIPIGNLTSQYFANMYLGMLDHQLKDVWKVSGYVRYMDDFVLFFDDKTETAGWLKKTRVFMKEQLKLELNEPQSNSTLRGIPALSYRIYGNCLRLSLKAKRRFKTKMKTAMIDGDRSRILPLLAFIDRAEADGFKESVMR